MSLLDEHLKQTIDNGQNYDYELNEILKDLQENPTIFWV